MNFIERLKTERDELATKYDALGAFIDSTSFDDVNFTQQLLLPIQLDAMGTYLTTLDARLEDLIDDE